MSGGPIQAAGDLASGAMLAAAFEPNAAPAIHGEAGRLCLNCRAPLTGPYCSSCGQPAHVHSTLSSIGHDFLHGMFHFEGKIWRTIPDLLIRPGELTRRYIAGERAKFVSPLALFLFTVFLMFAVMEITGASFYPTATVMRNGHKLSPAEVTQHLRDAQGRAAALQRQLAALPPADPHRKAVQAAEADAQDEASGLLLAERLNHGDMAAAAFSSWHPVTGWGGLDRRIAAALADPPLLVSKLEANAHKFTWALIPLSVPFLWLAFAWRREYRLFDHTVFIIYALAAVMLLMVARALLSTVGVPTGWALMLIPVHQFLQLRGAYRIGVWGALWRTAWLDVSAMIVLTLFAALLIAAGLLE